MRQYLPLTLLLSFGLLVAATLPLRGARAETSEVLAVVVAADAPLDALSLAELRRVFLGQAVERGGLKLIPLNHAAKSASRTTFDRLVLKMNPDEVGRYWVAQRIRGARSAPKSVSSSMLLSKVVAKIPGAIAYLPLSEVRPGLKALRIDGRRPSDPDYPLRP